MVHLHCCASKLSSWWGWKQWVLSSCPWSQDAVMRQGLEVHIISILKVANCLLVHQDAGWLFASSWHCLWRERIYSSWFSAGSWRASSRFSLSSQGLSVLAHSSCWWSRVPVHVHHSIELQVTVTVVPSGGLPRRSHAWIARFQNWLDCGAVQNHGFASIAVSHPVCVHDNTWFERILGGMIMVFVAWFCLSAGGSSASSRTSVTSWARATGNCSSSFARSHSIHCTLREVFSLQPCGHRSLHSGVSSFNGARWLVRMLVPRQGCNAGLIIVSSNVFES